MNDKKSWLNLKSPIKVIDFYKNDITHTHNHKHKHTHTHTVFIAAAEGCSGFLSHGRLVRMPRQPRKSSHPHNHTSSQLKIFITPRPHNHKSSKLHVIASTRSHIHITTTHPHNCRSSQLNTLTTTRPHKHTYSQTRHHHN